jgi:hypothetical protein
MSSLDFDLDIQMNSLEREWRAGYEASIRARAEWLALTERKSTDDRQVQQALDRIECAESFNARIMARIECLEGTILGED